MSKKFMESMKDKKLLNDCLMGPNCLTLIEEFTRDLPIARDMRVLDLGCGKGLTSMYLAERFGATVWAADLWVSPTENFERFKAFGLDDRVYPIHAEAHALPFADAFFDAVVSVDSYHYFGTEEGYLETHLTRLVKPGGPIAIVIPGIVREFEGGMPEELRPYCPEETFFHSCAWWADLWNRSGAVKNVRCGELESCVDAWTDWLETDNPYAVGDREMMRVEAGRYYNMIGLLANV